MTGDFLTNYPENRLPILDLKVWIEEVQPGVHKIITSHYIKDVSTRAVISSRSSHPHEMKVKVMTNEIMRILRNCNEYCPWEEVSEHVSYFMKRLQFSGYDQKFRYNVTRAALKKHKSIIPTDPEQISQKENTTNKKKW